MPKPLDTPEPPRIVPCPTCNTGVKWTPQNPFRPFCSERCRLIDFGAWANEQHHIPGDADHEGVNSEDLKPH